MFGILKRYWNTICQSNALCIWFSKLLRRCALSMYHRFPPPVVEIFIAWRYLRSHGRVPFFNTGTRVSFLFMALMVFVMNIVLSVFIGFQTTVHKTLQQSDYHLTVMRQNGRPFSEYPQILAKAQQDPNLKKILRYSFGSIASNVLLEKYGEFEGKRLHALPFVRHAPQLRQKMQYFPHLVHYNKKYLQRFDKGNYVLIGREMARNYGLQIGKTIRLLLPRGGFLNRDIHINQQIFVIAGFYRTGFYEFDANLIFSSLKTAQRVLHTPQQVNQIVFQVHDLDNLELAQRHIYPHLPQPNYRYSMYTIWEKHGNFLAALQLEKTLMLIILSLLIMAGVAGIWVTVRLSVRAKSQSIGMLRAMGMSSSSLLFIFTLHSIFIGFLATGIGSSLGIYVANQMETLILIIEDIVNSSCRAMFGDCARITLIPDNIYYFDHLPVQADLGIIFGISLATLILSGLAGYFPAREAAQLDPVQAIRNE